MEPTKLDRTEEAFRDHVVSSTLHLRAALNYDDTEPIAAGVMAGFYQGLYAALHDPKVARALIEVYNQRVWPQGDANDHIGVEKVVAAVRKIIGHDA